MKLGESLRADFIQQCTDYYKRLQEIAAPTIVRWNARKVLRKWQYKTNPINRFARFKNIEITGKIDHQKKFDSIETVSGSMIYLKKGRYGLYLDDKV